MDYSQDNPYAAPKANLADVMFTGDLDAQLAGGVTERELRAYVGKGADRYLMKWHIVLDGVSTRAGFNWAVLVLGGLYFAYRKMYRAWFIYAAVILVEAIAEDLICFVVLGLEEMPPGLEYIFGLVAALFCGLWANTWYLSHAKRLIAQTRAEGLPQNEYFDRLARRGGTSLLASIGCLVLGLVAYAAWLVLFEFLGGPPIFEIG